MKWTETAEAPRTVFPGAPNTVLTEHGGIVAHPRARVNPSTVLRAGLRERFRRKTDALAYRLLYLLFAPQALPEALMWEDGYLRGWQDATRSHLEKFIEMMGRRPASRSDDDRLPDGAEKGFCK